MMDRHMFKFICALLGFFSIIIPGPIIPIVCLIIAIGMLIVKIKQAKESAEGFEMLMWDIVCIVIVLVISIGLTLLRVSIEAEFMKKYEYSSSSSSTSNVAEAAISSYMWDNYDLFSSNKNNIKKIKSGFTNFLKNDLEIDDVTVNSNKIICNLGTEKIIFTITKNNITYSIQ